MKKKSSPKAAKPTPEYDSQRETRVLLEQMNKSINLIAEQHGSIKQEIKQEIHQLKENMNQRFNMLETAVMETNHRVRNIEGNLSKPLDKIENHEERVTRLEDKVGV